MQGGSIAIVGQLSGEPSENALEGPRRQTYYFARALGENRGYDVTVFTERYDERYNYEDEPFEVQPVTLDRSFLPVRLWQNIYFSATVMNAVRKREFDIVHLHRFYTVPLDRFGTYVLTMIGAETRQEVGDLDSLWEIAGDRINSFLQRRLLQSVDGSTAISPKLRDEIREYWNLDVDEVLPLGISDSFLAEEARSVPEESAILYASRISRKKNQEYLLQHLDYRERDLRLLGGIHEESYFERLKTDYPGSEECFRGFVPDKELLAEYRTARAYVLPSVHENFGFTALEAMASGTPVLVRDTVGIAGFLDPDGDDGAIVFSEPDGFTDALERLMTDDDWWEKLSANALRRARELRWPNVVDQYLEFYETVER